MLKVIILEKDFDLADNIREILNYGNFKVSDIGSGLNFDEIINKDIRPSIIIIGSYLKDRDIGYDELRKLREKFSCPILFLASKEPAKGICDSSFAIPNSAVLNKPFTFKTIHLAIHQLLNKPQVCSCHVFTLHQ
ncbi:hypothetical protein [Echinicola sp. 20G]|uniref:hypothetical protein n=1 Tax=Echinicola sp. 20G TaxID=2781961 RepID=UPI0019109724|nr:hypothetical protein [Echinicola sp. 20G]